MVSWWLKRDTAGLRIESDSSLSLGGSHVPRYAPALSRLTNFLFGGLQSIPAGQTSLEIQQCNAHSKHPFVRGDLQLRLIPAKTGLVLPPDYSMQPTSESGLHEYNIATTFKA
jgi:hypothetical protein